MALAVSAILVFLILSVNRLHAVSSVEYFNCTDSSECEASVGSGSECRQGRCTNNPVEKGCLRRLTSDRGRRTRRKRVCNSDDPPDAADLGICHMPEFDYMEIRIFGQNWESGVYLAWILQVVLSEILGVPTTIESGASSGKLNLYDPYGRHEYGSSNDWEPLERANILGDCLLANRNPEAYEPCAHLNPEVWSSEIATVREKAAQGILEPPLPLGALAQESWFMPQFTAKRDPTLVSYLGLQGEENRKKLAETFLTPTTWQDYCAEVSKDECATDDGIAKRAPTDDNEMNRMFVPGLYTGHFRKTFDNDCEVNPNCTGHIADYDCHWGSNVQQQTYHLNIALKSTGPGANGMYSLNQLEELWQAANATKSNLMRMWWQPEAQVQEFEGTDASFQRVSLPPPTQECLEARSDPKYRCTDDFEKSVGDAAGACEDEPQVLQKVVAARFQSLMQNLMHDIEHEGNEATLSPAYDVVQRFSLSAYQLNEIFDFQRNDSQRLSPREALCHWVGQNLDVIESFIPPTYPRVLANEVHRDPLFYIALFVGCLATFFVVAASVVLFLQRNRQVMQYAQVDFLSLLLAGALLVSIAAILAALEPTDSTCVALLWLINLGYTLELVPLLVKIAAINRLMNAAQQLKRVVLRKSTLYGAVVLIMVLVSAVLVAWTVIDPSHRDPEYVLHPDAAAFSNATMGSMDLEIPVYVQFYCHSSHLGFWRYFSVGWSAVLLICASVLAFQTRRLRSDFNESQTLSILIYSHFLFVLLRAIIYALAHKLGSESVLSKLLSLVYSFDMMVTIFVYFLPKFLAPDPTRAKTHRVSAYRKYLERQSTMIGAPFRTLPSTGISGVLSGGSAHTESRKSTASSQAATVVTAPSVLNAGGGGNLLSDDSSRESSAETDLFMRDDLSAAEQLVQDLKGIQHKVDGLISMGLSVRGDEWERLKLLVEDVRGKMHSKTGASRGAVAELTALRRAYSAEVPPVFARDKAPAIADSARSEPFACDTDSSRPRRRIPAGATQNSKSLDGEHTETEDG